ncbi:DUF2637 domain-containing protein [Streptomyces mirabilis]|uniref:DUF2637 domain-containing protein n=1 Tax=Streptomyces mirabilis TaxID=68239 RepID=UPI0036B4554D
MKTPTTANLTRAQRALIGVVVAGAVVIAGIGFAGSYAAVRELAVKKGFGNFAYVFPIGIDAGICVLLALDLLLTWIRIPFPLLRQTAWLLTAATIAFNGAAAWPDPLGTGMHAVIPVLFVVAVEAARHAIGRIADITADKHMEGVRLTRWMLSPGPTFLLWRRMKLWELRSYEQVIRLEQERLVYQARLRSRFGRGWRRKAPVESLMPLRLARYGVPLAKTAPAGLLAAGIDEPMPFLSAPDVDDAPVELEQESTEHQRALDTGESSNEATSHQEQAEADTAPSSDIDTDAAMQSEPAEEFDYSAMHFSGFADAYVAYLEQFGQYPNARQFGLYLAQARAIFDPATGGPIAEAQLRPVLQELRQQAEGSGERMTDPSVTEYDGAGPVTDPSVTGYDGSESVTDPTGQAAAAGGYSFFGAPSSTQIPAPQASPAAERVPAPTASVADTPAAMGRVPQQAAAQPPTGSVTNRGGGETPAWEATVTDTGEATARIPEQQTAETPVGELTEEQRIERIVQWLIEAEETGTKLSGAEASRRNDVSPSTGQRDMRKARVQFENLQRERGRGHLRSVRNNP